jgi:hypothetical protein
MQPPELDVHAIGTPVFNFCQGRTHPRNLAIRTSTGRVPYILPIFTIAQGTHYSIQSYPGALFLFYQFPACQIFHGRQFFDITRNIMRPSPIAL